MQDTHQVKLSNDRTIGIVGGAAAETEPTEAEIEAAVGQMFQYAAALRNDGHDDMAVVQKLQDELGLDAEQAASIVTNLDAVESAAFEEGGSGIPGWLVWIALLVGVNILSAIFDWPFWVY